MVVKDDVMNEVMKVIHNIKSVALVTQWKDGRKSVFFLHDENGDAVNMSFDNGHELYLILWTSNEVITDIIKDIEHSVEKGSE